MLTLKNITKFSQVVHSADGDSIIIPPSSIAHTEDKFLWQLNDSQVRIISRSDDGSHHRISAPSAQEPILAPGPKPLSNRPKNSHEEISARLDFEKVAAKTV